MHDKLIFLPHPRELNYTGGYCSLVNFNFIVIDTLGIQPNPHTVHWLKNTLQTLFHLKPKFIDGEHAHDRSLKIIFRLRDQQSHHLQGYQLIVETDQIIVEANHASGLFYGVCTLIQVISQCATSDNIDSGIPAGTIPCLEIQDWPDFPKRGVMLDISRDKVPTMETIFYLVDLLASWKINQLQLYTEHTFAYQRHPEVWSVASPFTAAEIQELDAFCQERFIELVPNQNSFGHMERWLQHPRYQYLAEITESTSNTWGQNEKPSCLCPVDPNSPKFITSLCDELLPNFSSHMINVGCDETFDIGKGRSRDACNQSGIGRVYFDYLLKLYNDVTNRGYQMQFWADMVLSHPELIQALPTDAIGLIWGYEADSPFERNADRFAQEGKPFYVCPGTSSWNSISGRTDNCLENQKNAAINGLNFGAKGYLNTDWGDNGHWQVLPVSYLGYAVGAAYSWTVKANEKLDVKEALNRFAFHDSTKTLGKIAYDLGNLYLGAGRKSSNSSFLFEIFQEPVDQWKNRFEPDKAVGLFRSIHDLIEQESMKIYKIPSAGPEDELLHREFILTTALLNHACSRGLSAYLPNKDQQTGLLSDLNLILKDYQSIWLDRNRPGGLLHSLSYFEIAKKEYQTNAL